MNQAGRILIFLLFLIGFFLYSFQPVCADGVTTPASKTEYGIIAGKWQRTDGNYLIKVSDVLADGQATVAYFNPNPIHVAQAEISTEKELIKLTVKFQDKGYEGSGYQLYYYAQKDALVGFYYQAPTNRTYKVIFLRKT
jgi:predicted carbohydrate-binding protein with CBM5 and CBM33 domain